MKLRIYVDWSGVEVFAGDGETTLAERVFPSASSRGVTFFSTGGEARRQFVLKWLKEKDLEREEREQALLSLTRKTFNYTRWTFYTAAAALVAGLASIAIALLHL